MPIAEAINKALQQGSLAEKIEKLLRIRDDDKLKDSARNPINGTVGWGEISKEQPPELSAVSIEHGILDYEDFPPINGVTASGLQSLIVGNQNRFPPYIAYDAGSILPRSTQLNQNHNAAPPSSWTNLMRRHVQALYGSYHEDYTCATQGADSTITYKNVGGQGVDTTLGCWWGGTAGLMRIGLFNYAFVLFRPTTIELFSTALTTESSWHRSWLIASMGTLSQEEIDFEEMGILAGLRPVPPSVIIYTRPGAPDAWEGAPLSYGWQFFDRWSDVASVESPNAGRLEAKVVCLGGGSAGVGVGSYIHTVTIDFNGTDYAITDTTATHATDASVAPGVAIMQLDIFGQLSRWGEAGTTPDGSSFPLMGHYTAAGAWLTEQYNSTSSGGVEQEVADGRDPCTGTASGRAGVWNHTYSAEASLSNLPNVRVATISTGSTTGKSTPYGTAATTGTEIIPQEEPTWAYGSPGGGDPCLDKPEDFHPVPCGEDNNPLLQYRWMEHKKERLTVRGGEYRGFYSAWATLAPARGEPGVWCVIGGESRTEVQARDTPLRRTASNLYEGRSIERGSSPSNICVGSPWNRANASIAWVADGTATDYPPFTATRMTVYRVAPGGKALLLEDGGVSDPIPSLPGGGSIMPIRQGDTGYDSSKTYTSTLWDNLANPQFGLFFAPPVSFSSSDGVVAYTEEPQAPPIVPLHWPVPYAGTFEPEGENWVFIGDV